MTRRLLAAAGYAIAFTLIYWGLTALLGAPHFVRPHHLADYLFEVGLLVFIGYFTGGSHRGTAKVARTRRANPSVTVNIHGPTGRDVEAVERAVREALREMPERRG